MSIRRLRVGDTITEGWLGELVALANACNLAVGQGGSLNMSEGPDGYTLDAVYSEPIWGEVTGPLASGVYPFKQIFPDASGAWTDGTLVDDAYEADGNTSVATGKRAMFWRTAEGDWRFRSGTC